MPRSAQEGNTSPLERARSFCITINNYSQAEWEKCQTLGTYGCIAKEIGESGTPHIQGYFYFANKKTFNGLKKALPRAHIKVCDGTACQNRTYIFGPYTKDDKYKPANDTAIEWGEMPKQGERVDLAKVKNEIENGKKVDEILMEDPYMYHQYGRTLSKIEDLMMRKKFRTEMTKGVWYWGKTGVGKSHKAFENYHPDTHYRHNLQCDWWDSYTQQETVIFNEFRGQIKFEEILDLCDKWPKTVKRRNREDMPFTSKLIIITSSMPPEEIYVRSLSSNDKMEQFYRRFEVIEL